MDDNISLPVEELEVPSALPTIDHLFDLRLDPRQGPFIIFFDPSTLPEDSLLRLPDITQELAERGVTCHWVPVQMVEGIPAVAMLAWNAIREWVGRGGQ